MTHRIFQAAFVFALLSLAGCATNKSLYYWGDYQPVVYDMYVNPGKADPQTQIEKLTSTIQKAQSLDKKVPPGLYAHLGMLYAREGSPAQAREAFNEEKAHFPESTTFIDGLESRAKLEEKQ